VNCIQTAQKPDDICSFAINSQIATCKYNMHIEQDTIDSVMRARSSIDQSSTSGNVASMGAAGHRLRAGSKL